METDDEDAPGRIVEDVLGRSVEDEASSLDGFGLGLFFEPRGRPGRLLVGVGVGVGVWGLDVLLDEMTTAGEGL